MKIKLCLAFFLSFALIAASREPVRARKAMVVSHEDHATQAGLRVLEQGGNAVDAAVAVGLALAVTHSSAGNLGGGGFMLIRLADGRSTFIDFRESAPAKASHNMYLDGNGKPTQDSLVGYRASGVPGTVKGLEYASQKYGTKLWASLVAPAIDLAKNGFPVSYDAARSLRNATKLARFPESYRIFQRNGKYYEPGENFVQPELGATLERIAKSGSKDFYEGETARKLADDMARHEGTITLDDLKNYRVVERTPLRGAYKGYEITTAPPPSSGGVGILQMMNVLDGTHYENAGAGSAASIHYIVEAIKRFFADRATYLGDTDFVKAPIPELISRSYADKLRATIDPLRDTPSSNIKADRFPGYESSETTHYSVVDSQGNAVAVTYTINGGYGSYVTPAGLGFLLNNEMDDFAAKPGSPNSDGLVQGEANAITPGKRPRSTMTPTIVTRDGKLYLVVGSPGGGTIVNTVLEVLLNVIDFHMDIQQAVDWPRFDHQWMPDRLNMEPEVSPDTVRALEAMGHHVRLTSYHQGDVAGIQLKDGWILGAPDSRSEMTARGY